MTDDHDDREYFRKHMADVRPLPARKSPVKRPQPRPEARFARADQQQVLQESLTGTPSADSQAEVSYAQPGVSPQVLRKLKRGKYSVASELDLHGLNVASAGQALDEFLAECRALGYRCVRIIHGKGTRSGSGGPVLKPKVCHWLRRRDQVLAFTTAPPNDGGSGALYVLLR